MLQFIVYVLRFMFDFLELQSFRRETILQYSLINRSEQLRILLLSLSAVISACAPAIAAELFQREGGADNSVAALGISAVSALGLGGLAYREKAARGQKLRRLEREFSIGELSATQPASPLAGARTVQLAELRDKQRVVAVAAPSAVLAEFVTAASVYRRRLAQSGVILVAVATDSEQAGADGEVGGAAAREAREAGWLWRPRQPAAWVAYFGSLLEAQGGAVPPSGAWLALSLKGRSVASGLGRPSFDELIGTKLPPLKPPRGGEAAIARTAEESGVLDAQAALYTALGAADAAAVAAMCAARDDEEVSSLAAGGRLDPWPAVLADGATAGLVLSGADATLVEGGQEAFSTGIELLASGETLLCTQRWGSRGAAAAAVTAGQAAGQAAVAGEALPDLQWRLLQHRTIPYMVQTDAGAALRCDRRGCVGLQRSGIRGAPGMPGDGMS